MWFELRSEDKMRALTRDVAERLLESFRLVPSNGTAAARHAGCNPKTALKAWRKGLHVVGFVRYKRPFKDIIAEEQLEARARMQEEKEQVRVRSLEAEVTRLRSSREKAIKDITDTRIAEGALVRAARTTTGQALGALAQTGAGVAKVSQLVRKALEQLVVTGPMNVVCVVTDPVQYAMNIEDGLPGAEYLRPMTVVEAKGYSQTLAQFATALRQVNDAAQKALEMERLLLGEPTSIIAHKHLDGMTTAEAEQHVQAAVKALARFKEKGALLEDAGVAGDETIN